MTSRPQTVTLVAHGIHDAGGMERAFAELIRRMPPRYRATVVSSELEPALRPLVDWRRVPAPARPFPLRFVAFFVLGGLRLRTVHSDLVHTLGAIVPNRADAAEVQFCHAGFVESVGRLGPTEAPAVRRLNTAVTRLLSLSAERWCYRPRRVRRFVAVSDDVGGELVREYPGVPYTVAANGVDTERYRPDARVRRELRDRLGVADDAVVALFVGGDWDRKGLPVLVEALASVPAVLLWVVGPGDRTRVEELARSVGVLDRIKFFGRRADGERFYAAADVFCLPSLYEAHPLAALEAAASALPLVATTVNGIPDLVGDDEAGIIVERTAAAVGGGLARLAGDRDLRRRLGEAARRKAERYTWDASARSVLATYDELLGEKDGGRQR